MDLFDRLKDLREQGLAEIKEAESEKSLNDVRVKLVGKKGKQTQILHQMKDVAPEKRPTPAPYGYGAVHVGGHARQRLPGMPCRRHEWRLARDTYGRPLALRLKIGRPLARLHDDGGHGHIALQFLQGTPKGARGAGRCFPKAHGQWKG